MLELILLWTLHYTVELMMMEVPGGLSTNKNGMLRFFSLLIVHVLANLYFLFFR